MFTAIRHNSLSAVVCVIQKYIAAFLYVLLVHANQNGGQNIVLVVISFGHVLIER